MSNLKALKFDNKLDKLPWNLLPFRAIEGLLRVLYYGERKYSYCEECFTNDKPTLIYPNPKLNGDPPRNDCPNCGSKNIKAGSHNWRLGFKWSRLVSSSYRHLASFVTGDLVDSESGELHIHHLMANIAFLAEHVTEGYGENDLWKYKNKE